MGYRYLCPREIPEYRAAIRKAATELEAEHQPSTTATGCVMCWPAEGSRWPCVSAMVAKDLREILEDVEP